MRWSLVATRTGTRLQLVTPCQVALSCDFAVDAFPLHGGQESAICECIPECVSTLTATWP